MPKPVFLRDPREERYPWEASIGDFASHPRWLYATFDGHHPPDHVAFLARRYFAYVADDGDRWDALFGFADPPELPPEVDSRDGRSAGLIAEREWYHSVWAGAAAEQNRGVLRVVRTVHYDRILAIDEDGTSTTPARTCWSSSTDRTARSSRPSAG